MTRIEISLKTIFTILIVGALLFVFSRVTDIIIQIFIAFVLMTALNPVVGRLQKLKMPRGVAIAITYIILICLIVVVFAATVPAFIDQTSKLIAQLNLPSTPLLDRLKNLQLNSSQLIPLLSQYSGSVGKVFDVVFSTFSVLFTFFTVLVMTLYFLLDRENLYRYFAFMFQSGDREERSKKMVSRIEVALGSWVRGEFLLMLAIGVMTFVGLTLLNIPFALPLSIFAGLMEALPNIGPTLSAIPAVVVALVSVSPVMAGVTTLLYILVQQLENNFIVPQVMKHATGIRPLTTIVLILMGYRFGGVLGALLAIPIFIVAKEILEHFLPEIRNIRSGD